MEPLARIRVWRAYADIEALWMRQFCPGIDPKLVVHGADQVTRRHWSFLYLLTVGIRSANDLSAFEPTTGDQSGKDTAEMVASAVPGGFPQDFRGASELAATPDDCRIEQAVERQV